jgi:predicted SAM-dependent methyltransferase
MYFMILSPLARLSGIIYRIFLSPRKGTIKVHLGPGQKRYIKGWINVDANIITARCDVWADFSHKLPFRDNTVDVFYTHHVLEHLTNQDFHVNELFRCLKPGGIVRVGVPNGDAAIQKFIENDHSWFPDFPTRRKSIGGRFLNYLLCDGEHKAIITCSFLKELLENAGFGKIVKCLPMQSTGYPQVIDKSVLTLEHESCTDCPHTLIIEAQKPTF